MGFSLTSSAPEKCDPTAKNRVWGFFGEQPESSRQNRPQSLQRRRENRPTTTKVASGRAYWPSRDPIGEQVSKNLYQMVGNNSISNLDAMGLATIIIDDQIVTPPRVEESPEVQPITSGEDWTTLTTLDINDQSNIDADSPIPCKGHWENVKTSATLTDGVWFELGSFDFSWYGVGAVKVCKNMETKIKADLVCVCCPDPGGTYEFKAPKPFKVCIEIEVGYLQMVSLAALLGVPIPGSRVIAASSIGAFVIRADQKLTKAYKDVAEVKRYHDGFKKWISEDTEYATRVCRGEEVPALKL